MTTTALPLDSIEAIKELLQNPKLGLQRLDDTSPAPLAAAASRLRLAPNKYPKNAAADDAFNPLLPRLGIHEWFYESPGICDANDRRHWFAPLTTLAHLAAAARQASKRPLIFWIGSVCHPSIYLLESVLPGGIWQSCCILISPKNAGDRFWAIEHTLQSTAAAAVVADVSQCSATQSRRLQLAAEAGKGIGLLARPPWEQHDISNAATRWMVSPTPATSNHPTWQLKLLRSRGPLPVPLHHVSTWRLMWHWDNTHDRGQLQITTHAAAPSPPDD
ncbi:MAG: hypothetical protein HKL96_12620 [Phycisphaerales bacterium]|nr:hypothetical protein [Phycisphaerales bacterium]